MAIKLSNSIFSNFAVIDNSKSIIFGVYLKPQMPKLMSRFCDEFLKNGHLLNEKRISSEVVLCNTQLFFQYKNCQI